MAKEIEKRKHPVIITLLTLAADRKSVAALAGLIRYIVKIANSDYRFEEK